MPPEVKHALGGTVKHPLRQHTLRGAEEAACLCLKKEKHVAEVKQARNAAHGGSSLAVLKRAAGQSRSTQCTEEVACRVEVCNTG